MAGAKQLPISTLRLVLLVVSIIIVFGAIWLWSQSATTPAPQAETAVAPSSEWTTAPEDGVEVDLPEVPVTAAPIEGRGS